MYLKKYKFKKFSFGNNSPIKRYRGLAVLVVVAACLIIARIWLPTYVKSFVLHQLNRDPQYRATIDDLDLHIWRGAVSVQQLNIQRIEGQKQYPLIRVSEIDGGLSWRDLFRGAIVATADVYEPVINLVRETAPEEGKTNTGETKAKVKIGASTDEGQRAERKLWQDIAKELMPIDLNLFSVHDGSLHYRDITTTPKVDVYIDRIQLRGRNLTNSEKMGESLFASIHMDARAMRTGQVLLETDIDPLSRPIKVNLNFQVEGLHLTDLNELFTAYGKFDVKRGSFSLFSEVASKDNKIVGYVKPMITDLDVADFEVDQKKGVVHAFWQQIVGTTGFFLKNFNKDRQAVRIPFSQDLDDPKIDLWEAGVSVFQNIFVRALSPQIEGSIDLKDVPVEKK